MKTLRQLCAALVLTLTLAFSAFAGDISTTIAPPPPPGEMTGRSGDMSTTVTATDLVVKTALNLYHSMLAVF